MLKVGLTGGIGSGKSTVAKLFAELGIPVYYADDAGRRITNAHSTLEKLRALFGNSIFKDNELDRMALAKLVFGDSKKLAELNDLIHPLVAEDFENWCAKQTAPYIIKEAAIMIESGSFKAMAKIILVTAPEMLKIERVMQRDGVSSEQVKQRMSKQWNDEQKRPYCDFEIINDGRPLNQQVDDVHAALKIQLKD